MPYLLCVSLVNAYNTVRPVRREREESCRPCYPRGSFWEGHIRSSGESLIGTSRGVVKARDVYRRTLSERYSVETLKTVVGVPRQMTQNRDIDHEEIHEFRVVPGDEGGARTSGRQSNATSNQDD